MTTSERISKLEKEVRELKALFSSLVPHDDEGEYSEEFIQSIKEAKADVAAGRVYSAEDVKKELGA